MAADLVVVVREVDPADVAVDLQVAHWALATSTRSSRPRLVLFRRREPSVAARTYGTSSAGPTNMPLNRMPPIARDGA